MKNNARKLAVVMTSMIMAGITTLGVETLLARTGRNLVTGIVQTVPEHDLTANRDKITAFIREARTRGCDVVVFPECALYIQPEVPKSDVDAAIETIRKTVDANDIYTIFSAPYKRTETTEQYVRLWVISPDGEILQCYEKLWANKNSNEAPGLFYIDGIPCSAIICADRWLRALEDLPAVDGAQILFECSGNYDREWIEDLQWYWYVPRALRNNAFTVFCNSAAEDRSLWTLPTGTYKVGHGHCTVIGPDGRNLVSLGTESDSLIIAEIDLSQASRTEAIKRSDHPLFKPFWETGLRILHHQPVSVTPVEKLVSPAVSITIAAAQMACSRNVQDNVSRMQRMIRDAAVGKADVIVFPALAVTGAVDTDIRSVQEPVLQTALERISESAKSSGITVVFGMPHRSGDHIWNCAWVINPDGQLATRYDQLVVDRPEIFSPGRSTQSMWFRIKDVPGVVTVGGDALWSEIAELAAVRGAQIHLHLEYDRDAGPADTLIRKQIWVNLASFRTLTATVNAADPAQLDNPSATAHGGSILWEDYHRSHTGAAGGYFPYSAVRIAEAGAKDTVIYATQTTLRKNPHPILPVGSNPQMKDWYEMGAHVIFSRMPE